MALLPILTHPNEHLHIVAQPVAQVDERIRTLVQDMAETMYASKGIGLAATQVDVHERVVVIDLSEEKNQLLALINPGLLVHPWDLRGSYPRGNDYGGIFRHSGQQANAGCGWFAGDLRAARA